VDQQGEDPDQRVASRVVADALRAEIDAGVFKVGDALPTSRQLAQEYGVARNTAMAAVRVLRDEGLVTDRPNARAVVRDRKGQANRQHELRALRAELGDLRSQIRQAGANLAAVDDRLSEVVARLSALE
jgi:DNA-binding FadR family transcriptional regulator